MRVRFTYRDFDGKLKDSAATLKREDGELWAVNLETFGCGKRVLEYFTWSPEREALKLLMGGREITTWSQA